MAMTLVSTTTVPSGGAANIEWTNIPQTGKDLLVVASIRTSADLYDINATVNNSTSGYSYRRLTGNGSTASSFGTTTSAWEFQGRVKSTDTANTFSNVLLYFSNYNSNVAKSVSIDAVTETNATQAFQTILAGSWSGTNSITSIKLEVDAVQHSTASLYIIS